MTTECAHGQLARSCEICERDNTIATLRQEIRLMHEDVRAKEARIAELERELMAISQDDGKVERALERAHEQIAELERALRSCLSVFADPHFTDRHGHEAMIRNALTKGESQVSEPHSKTSNVRAWLAIGWGEGTADMRVVHNDREMVQWLWEQCGPDHTGNEESTRNYWYAYLEDADHWMSVDGAPRWRCEISVGETCYIEFLGLLDVPGFEPGDDARLAIEELKFDNYLPDEARIGKGRANKP